MDGLINTNFWLLAPPQNQKRATLAEDTKLEQITCSEDENHRRGGRRVSDLFIIWPLPRYHFASDRLASILRAESITGVKLVPAAKFPFEPGNVASPGLLQMWMPASRARVLGDRLGIN
jgi:hypothetical protein